MVHKPGAEVNGYSPVALQWAPLDRMLETGSDMLTDTVL